MTKGFMEDLFPSCHPMQIADDTVHLSHRLYKAAYEQGYELIQVSSGHEVQEPFEWCIVFEVFPQQIASFAHLPKEKLALFLWEPPSVIPENYIPYYHSFFSRVYTWNDDWVDNKKYFKFFYPSCHPMIQDLPLFETKRLSTLIAANKGSAHPYELYSQRRAVILFFEQYAPKDFDLFGRGWPEWLSTYKGIIDDKIDTLKHYKFSFCYENIHSLPGYVTEKIFDCFAAGVVPIYWDASNASGYIPEDCYLARTSFDSLEELYHTLEQMTPLEHAEYLNRIRTFLESDQAQLFSMNHFVDLFMNLITNQRN